MDPRARSHLRVDSIASKGWLDLLSFESELLLVEGRLDGESGFVDVENGHADRHLGLTGLDVRRHQTEGGGDGMAADLGAECLGAPADSAGIAEVQVGGTDRAQAPLGADGLCV